jgi:putative membrane protein
MKRMGFLSIALAAVVAVGCDTTKRTDVTSNPPAVGTAGETDRSKASNGDADFVKDMSIAGMAEVELGKMAAERASNAEVKKFGQMMVRDHTAAANKLKAVASQHNIPVPTTLDDKHQELRDKLAGLRGAEFDRQYMSAMVDGHESVADKLESRIDKNDLAKWKTETTDAASGKKVTERVSATSVFPEKSDNAVTMSINEWAAQTYPTVQAHYQSAKAIDGSLTKQTTTR